MASNNPLVTPMTTPCNTTSTSTSSLLIVHEASLSPNGADHYPAIAPEPDQVLAEPHGRPPVVGTAVELHQRERAGQTPTEHQPGPGAVVVLPMDRTRLLQLLADYATLAPPQPGGVR